MFKKILLWCALISCMSLIFYFSSQEATESQNTSSRFIKTIVKIVDFKNTFSDEKVAEIAEKLSVSVRKIAHFSIYALLGLIFALLISQYKIYGTRQFLFALIFCFLYACSDEIHQLFVPGRSGEIKDVLLDTFGGAFGIGITKIILIRRDRKWHILKNTTNGLITINLTIT